MATTLPTKGCTTCKSFEPEKKYCKLTGADLERTYIAACSWRNPHKVMRCDEHDYKNLPEEMKRWRAGVFVKLVKALETKIPEPDLGCKIANFVDLELDVLDFKYMSYDDLCFLRAYELVETSEIMELYPEYFEPVDPEILEYA